MVVPIQCHKKCTKVTWNPLLVLSFAATLEGPELSRVLASDSYKFVSLLF